MSYSTILAVIKTRLDATTNIGSKTYDYERADLADWSRFLNDFKVGSIIKAWTITRSKVMEEAETSRTNKATHTFVIRGYYSFGNYGATETTFQDLLENIRTAFRNYPTLSDAALQSSPIQIPIIEQRMFGKVLCHYAEMTLDIEEEEQWTDPA